MSLSAQERRPHSVLVLDQSDLRGPFYHQLWAGLRGGLEARTHTRITIYGENLGLNRFGGTAYEQSLKTHLKEKYKGKPVGVIVALGKGALEYITRWRSELWPDAPIVFAMLDEADLAKLERPAHVTGVAIRNSLGNAVEVARAVTPGLDTIALVGDAWEKQVLFSHWNDEIPGATASLKVIDLVGYKMSDVRQRVAELPERSAIIYTALFSDGEGTFYPPATALSIIAQKANRPIVVGAEPLLQSGGIGGYVLLAPGIGADTAQLVLRILDGEAVEAVQPVVNLAKPIFSWPELQRWNVDEANLPAGSQIRFREMSLLEKYRWQSLLIAAAMLVQAGLIMFLLHERHLRHYAEVEAQNRMTELAHINRQATTGELSSSIAHELNQPLGSILTNAETAELMLKSDNPDLGEIREILCDIKRDDLRAGEVLRRLRGLLKRTPFETRDLDLNEIVGEAFKFMSVQASARNIALYLQAAPGPLRIKGDPIHLQQVILNLVVNSMDAMAAMPYGRTVIGRTELCGEAAAVVSISDSGPGIPADKLNQIFDPFFTTKKQGLGIGLSIARTIVLAHRGQIWAENQSSGGAAFRFKIPLATWEQT
jgi:signal transduction histidine kinase